MPNELVSLEEICRILSVDHIKVYEWMSTRKLPAHLVDGVWRFDPREVETWRAQTPPEDA